MSFSRYLNHQGIDIARGLIVGTSSINKFGFTGADVAVNTVETVWDGNGTTPIYPYPADAVITIAGDTNTADDGEIVVVEGLDANYVEQSEQIAVGGTGTLTFHRIFRAYMETTSNSQDINLSMGATLAAVIKEGLAQTEMALYTIPAGKCGYLMNIHGSTTKATGNPACQFRIKVLEDQGGGVFRIKGQFGTAGGQSFTHEYPVPLKLEPKSDIRIDVIADAATGAGAIFDIILVDL